MKPKVAIHKFSSCDGCQLAFIHLGEPLLELAQRVDLVHFAEAGPVDPDADVDIAFIEGSITNTHDIERITRIREKTKFLVTIGACATSGGIQALRSFVNVNDWVEGIYAHPEYIHTLAESTPISQHVKVDFELWGCPVSGRQVVETVRALLFGVKPVVEQDKVCLECKRQQLVCTLVTRDVPCMGPVTRTGCGALCPNFGRDCHACYGPAENPNTTALARRFAGFGLLPEAIARRFLSINNAAPAFREAGLRAREKRDG